MKPTAILRHILKDLSLVYDVHPQHYYFEITNGYLFIKYQSIIGSRRIAKLMTPEQEKELNEHAAVQSVYGGVINKDPG